MEGVEGEDFDNPISLVGVGCTTRFHLPRTARPRSVQSEKATTQTRVCHLAGEAFRAMARWSRGPPYVRHLRGHRACRTSAKTGHKKITSIQLVKLAGLLVSSTVSKVSKFIPSTKHPDSEK